MKNSALTVTVLVVMAIPFIANAHGSSSSVSIGIHGNHGTFHYSRHYHSVVCHHSTTIIRHGGGYYGGHRRVYYGGGYYGGSPRHIHRQEGRVYYESCTPYPVIVVPATNRHHRHYHGCGCGY